VTVALFPHRGSENAQRPTLNVQLFFGSRIFPDPRHQRNQRFKCFQSAGN